MNYEIKPLSEEEEEFVLEKIYEYANEMAPSEPHTEEEQLVYKVENEEGSIIGGCVVNIHEWGRDISQTGTRHVSAPYDRARSKGKRRLRDTFIRL